MVTEERENSRDVVNRMVVTRRSTTDPQGRWQVRFEDATDTYFVVAANGVRVAEGFENFPDAQFLVWCRDHVAPMFERQISIGELGNAVDLEQVALMLDSPEDDTD